MTSRSRFDLMRFWVPPADLQHIESWVLLQPERVLFKCAVQVLSCIICSGTKCTFQNVKVLTTNCPFIVSLLAVYFIKREPAYTGISPESCRNQGYFKRDIL
jgi:hypothetical protein